MPDVRSSASLNTTFIASAPGRVNLIGEHTDYNGGMVLPAALSVQLNVELSLRTDDRVIVTANGFGDPARRTLNDPANGDWSDAAVGALREAKTMGLLNTGAKLTITSTIPAGAGLSSSAALIVAVLKAARNAGNGRQDDAELAVAARRVENDYIGVPCGIMDQMAVALAKPGYAMALDTRSLDYRLIPLPRSHQLIVLHSGISRRLNEGRYADRKEECDIAKAFFSTDDLCLIGHEAVRCSELEEPFKSRALHCASEHARTMAAASALEAGEMTELGALMNASHASMRDDFDISLPSIDFLVDDAVKLGALGARLTGGGFGGCIVALVKAKSRDEWLDALITKHPKARFIDAA